MVQENNFKSEITMVQQSDMITLDYSDFTFRLIQLNSEKETGPKT